MPVYDTTFILNPQLEESGLDSRVQEYINMIGNNGGKMVKENRIGMRRLAYEIQNLNQGYYISLVFDGSPDLVTELERRMRMDEGCIRFLTCLYQDFSARRKDKKKKKVKKEHPADEQEPQVARTAPQEETPAAANDSAEEEPPDRKEPDVTDAGEELL